MKIKRFFVTVIVCAIVLIAAALLTGYWNDRPNNGILKVGFVYSEDESTPYTANFVMAQRALQAEYGGKIDVMFKSNILARESEQPMRDLIRSGCRILFINMDTDIEGAPDNYHTFNGEIYQARYVSGVVAGMKLRQLLDSGAVLAKDAYVGYVAANSTAEVISGYTAFILGVRSVAPEAVMRVRYTGSWSNYNEEKKQAKELIDEGCVIIAQHVNTMAPAVACEEAAAAGRRVYHVGYHQSMMDVAPSSALVSIRTNWAPYVIQAVQAVMDNQEIEEAVEGNVHGKDMSAGFSAGWVELLEMNRFVVAEGTEAKVERTIEGLKKGRIKVFYGNYIGVNPMNPADTIDLNTEYIENQYSSRPSFNYILKDCIMIEN